jgi:endonuclease YncB( thermonuclease family)
VGLLLDPAADSTDRYGRLLRYVVRLTDGVNVNLRLVSEGAAAVSNPADVATLPDLFESGTEF